MLLGEGEVTCALGQAEQQSFLHPGFALMGWGSSRLSFLPFVFGQPHGSGEGRDAFGGFMAGRLGFLVVRSSNRTWLQPVTLHPCCGHGNWPHWVGCRTVAVLEFSWCSTLSELTWGGCTSGA